MRTFKGKTIGTKRAVLARIATLGKSDLQEGDWLYVNDSAQELEDCAGVVLAAGCDCATPDGLPVFRLDDSVAVLHEGDVVNIEPRGILTVLYEASSYSNALLLTEKCNCRCLICPQPPKNEEGDSTEFLLNLIELMNPETEVLAITGGASQRWCGKAWSGSPKRVVIACHRLDWICLPMAVY